MEIVFTFRNTHEAMTGEQALIGGGVRVRVMALPSSLGAGCGLCLRVDAGDLEAAVRLLTASRLQPEGIYAKHNDGGRITYSPATIC